MSFFGFDTSGHNQAQAGFSQAHNPFAGLSGREEQEEGDALEFEETYDGLGDRLEETNDAFNDDTFGDSVGPTSGPVGKDFDFFGQTAKVSDAIEEEHVLFNRQHPTSKPAPAQVPAAALPASYNYNPHPAYKPSRSGYEKYKEEPFDDLQVDATLWGVAPKKQPTPATSAPAQPPAAARKFLSLEEVEAQMRAQSKPAPFAEPSLGPQVSMPQSQGFDAGYQFPHAEPLHAPIVSPGETSHQHDSHPGHGHPVTILQRPQSKQSQEPPHAPIQHRQQAQVSAQPTHILQNPNRLSSDGPRIGHHKPQGSFSQSAIITHPSQLAQLTEDEKAAYLEQEAKRAKRNHKIYLMSRDNGIMTPQDKNFVTRIQLQQLVSATGNPNDHGTDESLAEDFYYQVHSQIQGGQRQHPSQPLNNFAQTYLFQTGSRQGGYRRQNRGPENHVQRMEQQVQRAVEAAKNKPKNKQLVIEGSLGKISFSNAKTPKPLLNIKRADAAAEVHRPASSQKTTHVNGADSKKSDLRSIEKVYSTLMKMEDHDRSMPPPPANDADTEAIERFVAWRNEAQQLNGMLWAALRVHDQPEHGQIHPFISFLSYGKGKKAMQRVFRHTSPEQRTTILTRIVVNLDNLDVVRNAQVSTDEARLNAAMRENVELFSNAVMPTLFNFMNELDLGLVAGVLGLVCTRNVGAIAKSRIGISMLTMILSRAEIIKHGGGGSEPDWQSWYV